MPEIPVRSDPDAAHSNPTCANGNHLYGTNGWKPRMLPIDLWSVHFEPARAAELLIALMDANGIAAGR